MVRTIIIIVVGLLTLWTCLVTHAEDFYSSSFDVIIDDFQVNDIDSSAVSAQSSPDIGIVGDGSYVLTWVDGRNGDADVYAQRFDDEGQPVGSNFRVNDDDTGADVWSPSVDVASDGSFVIVWMDGLNDQFGDIYGQRYDANGIPLGTNFEISEDAHLPGTILCQSDPCVAVGDEIFLVVWKDGRVDGSGVFGQSYDLQGLPLGNNFMINDETSAGRSRGNSSVATSPDGHFVVTWTELRSGKVSVFVQRFDSNGDRLGDIISVNENPTGDRPTFPDVGVSEDNRFVVVWGEGTYEDCEIYGRLFNREGVAENAPFRVTDDQAVPECLWPKPTVSMGLDGSFIVGWEDEREGNVAVYGQHFDSLAVPRGDNFRVSEVFPENWQRSPCAHHFTDGRFIFAWEDFREANIDVYLQEFSDDGTSHGGNVKVNDDTTGSFQGDPNIGVDAEGNFVVSWRDYKTTGSIVVQRFNAEGERLGSNLRANEEVASPWYHSMDVASNGSFATTWMDDREGSFTAIYAQRFDSTGHLSGSNFKVNDDTSGAAQYYPTVGMDPSGKFAIVWEDSRNVYRDIYAQLYQADGMPIEANFMVNAVVSPLYEIKDWPALGFAADGSFIVCWYDDRHNNNLAGDIYAQRYNADGTLEGLNFKINDIPYGINRQSAIAVSPEGACVIVWSDFQCNVWAKKFDAEGNPIGSDFRVNEEEIYMKFPPSITVDVAIAEDETFVITWTDYRNGLHDPDIYAQICNAAGEPLGGNFRVNGDDSHKNQIEPSVAFGENGHLYFTWQDNRSPGQGYNIYAKVIGLGETPVSPTEPLSTPSDFSLFQNYPNPFNATTDVRYQIPDGRSPVHTILKIYNVLGQRVRTLVDEFQKQGWYTARWDGKDNLGNDLPSGVYFYCLSVDGGQWSETKRMVLVR